MSQKKHSSQGTAVGSSSLLVIFGVVCFTMLALLSLNTVLAQQRLTESSIKAEQAYWAADLEAQTIFARLRAGEQVEGVARQGDVFLFSCPVTDYQALHVELEKTQDGWRILRWQAVADPEITEENLPVWEGG